MFSSSAPHASIRAEYGKYGTGRYRYLITVVITWVP